MGKKTPSPPPAPDPVVVNAAQTASNKETALYNAALNRVDQYGPQGSITYTKLANDADGLPHYRSDTTLSPEAQKQYDIEQQVGTATSQLGADQLGRLQDALSQKFSFDGLPKAPGVDDFSVDRDKVTQSIIDRNNPQMQAARNALENKLVNQGVMRGSKGWKQAMDDLGRQENDFRLAAINAGGAEQSRLYGLGTDARTRAIQEYTTQRNQPLNELSALLGQSQIQNPSFGAAPGANAAPVDTSAAYNQQYQGQLAAYNAQNQARQSAMGNLFGLGGAALGGWASNGFNKFW